MTQINKRIIASLKYITVLACATIAISSCQREEFRIKSGETIRFTATTSGSSLALTKAEYSGEFNTDNTKERIDWQVGDLIRIYCAEASKPESKFADYFIDQEPTSAGAVSGSSVSLMDSQTATGLRWGATDKDHVFYAVYPSPATAGCGDGSIGDDTMTGVISETQKPLKLSTGSNPDFTAVPNLNSEYMVATNTIAAGSFESSSSVGSEDVFLTFKPIVTAIEFTIKNGFKNDGDLNIKEVQLISASHPIAGAFAADLTGLNAEGSAYPKCTSSSTQKTVKMDFTAIPDYDYSGNAEISGSKKYLKIAKDKTLRFTFFLMPGYNGTTPVDVDDLTFKIVKADGSWISTKLAYNDAAKAGVKFPCHKKSYVQGLLVPEGAQWIVKYDPTVQSWDTDTDDINPMPETDGDPLVTSWDTGIDEELTLMDQYNGHEYVEIGGIKWATCNIGANSPKEYGWYFSWAGTTGYVYDNTNSKWVTQGGSELSGGFTWANTPYHEGNVETGIWKKYIPTGQTGYWSGVGSPDNKLFLELVDDAARANWGGSWRMPTKAEFQKLYEDCGGTGESIGPVALPSANPGKGIYWVSNSQTYISDYNGVAGILFCDGVNKLFFVAAGYSNEAKFVPGGTEGRYWSSTVCSPPNKLSNAYRLGFFSGNVSVANANDRKQGFPVRPVSD